MNLLKTFLLIWLLTSDSFLHAQSSRVIFQTNLGDIEVELFDKTPHHRDMFLKAIKDSVYQNALFNRVIANFVNQGGELDEPILEEEKKGIREKKRLPAEIVPEYFHFKGALGAGRDDNPEKASYYSQIYFVIGKVFTEEGLDSLEKKRNIRIPLERRSIYTSIGGVPHLDRDYTIFGRVINGLDIVEKINQSKTSNQDLPIDPIPFSVHITKDF